MGSRPTTLLATRGVAERVTVSRATALGVATAMLVAFLVRVPYLSWPLIADEGAYAYTAHWWFNGLTLYTDELWFDKPQAIFVAYRLGSMLLGDSPEAIRAWGALWAAGTAGAVWLVARHLFDRRTATLAALIAACASGMPFIEGFTANAETFMVLPATLSAYFLLRRRPVLAGLCAGAAIGLKPSGASALMLAAIWLAYTRESPRTWLLFGAAAASLPLLMLWHGAATAGFREYLDAVLLQRTTTPRPDPGDAIVEFVRATMFVLVPLCLLAAVGLWTVQRRTAIFLGAWLASAFLGVAMGGNWWAHYAIQLVAPLSVGAAAGVIRLHRGWAPLRWFATAVLAASVLLSVPYFLLPAAEGSWALYGRPAYIVGEDVADYVESRTTGQDRIFVAYSQPEMHYLSERRSPVPYLYREFFVAHPEGFGPLLGMMERGDVDVVVTVGRTLPEIDPDGRFEEALALHYQVAREFRVGDYVDLEQAPMEYEPVRVYIPRQPTEQVSAESDTLVLSLPVQPGDQPRRGQRAA